jgi:hypothetical protein
MPRYLKQDGKKVPNVRTENAWIVIPIKSSRETETFLVQPRIADYIVKLEKQINNLKKLKHEQLNTRSNK